MRRRWARFAPAARPRHPSCARATLTLALALTLTLALALTLTLILTQVRVYSEGGRMPGGLYDHPTIRNGDVRARPLDPALTLALALT